MKSKLTLEFAELIGILFGDGYINHHSNGHYFIEIAGHSIKDLHYHKIYINNLMKKLFGIEARLIFRKGQNTIYSRISSKKVFTQLVLAGMPTGKKENLYVPKWIKDDFSFFQYFLRGLYDTDGSIILRKRGQHSIGLSLKNKGLILEVKNFFERMGYTICYTIEKRNDPRGFSSTMYSLRINQKALIKRFLSEIGSSNAYKLKKLKKVTESGVAGI